MGDAVSGLWGEWSRGPGSAALVACFLVLGALWIASAALTARQAHRDWRPAGLPTAAVLLVPLAVASVGLTRPPAFHVWALVGLALGPLLALTLEATGRRYARTCPESHPLAPAWAFCPVCPSPIGRSAPDQQLAVSPLGGGFVGRGVATLLRRPLASPPLVGPPPAGPPDDLLVRLLPAIAGAGEVVIRRPGARIGRNPAAQVSVDDPTVSWDHAQIVTRDGAPAVVDLGSSNGTYLNGERVEQGILLAGDELQIGGVIFRVVRP